MTEIDIMSEPDQCIICLDLLPRPSEPTQKPVNGGSTSEAGPTTPVPRDDSENLDLVAALDGCEHVIHDACIRSWAQKTNTCPICRNIFHSVRVFNGLDGKLNQEHSESLPNKQANKH